MDSRERVLRTISRQQTDRIPMDITYTDAQTLARLKEYLKIYGDMELFRYLGADTDRIKPLELKKNTKPIIPTTSHTPTSTPLNYTPHHLTSFH